MMLYAIGALAIFDALYDIQTVRMTIAQPRLDSISTCELSVEELMFWAETELRPKAELAIQGEGDYVAGEHCRFCRAKRSCRARAENNLELAKLDFKLPPLLSDEEVTEALSESRTTHQLGRRHQGLRTVGSIKSWQTVAGIQDRRRQEQPQIYR